MYGASAGLPTLPTSADGLLKLSPGSIAEGFGRVIVRDTAARTTALRPMWNAALADGKKFA